MPVSTSRRGKKSSKPEPSGNALCNDSKLFFMVDAERIIDTANVLADAERKIARLQTALESTLDLLGDIRYVTWPTIGLGIGLSPERMDEVMISTERALLGSKRKYRPRKSS